mgnify:CR=1 FL=1
MPKLLLIKLLLFFNLISNHALALAFSLPENTQTPVIIYHSLSGNHTTDQQTPLVTVFSDGRVIAGSPSGLEHNIESSITQQHLQNLLDEIINKTHFFDIDTKVISQKIIQQENASNKILRLMDSNTDRIKLTLQQNTKTQEFYGLSEAALQFSSIAQLADLAKIKSKLHKLRNWILVGSNSGLTKELSIANQQLFQKHPNITAVTEKDLNMATRQKDGKRIVHFQRRQLNKTTQRIEYSINIYNYYDKTGFIKSVVNIQSN